MQELTLEQQQLLTEFLGECWHELHPQESPQVGPYEVSTYYICKHCGKRESRCIRLDFSDWRVVGRLIEKATIIETWKGCRDEGWYARLTPTLEKRVTATPQLAICLAICEWLKEKCPQCDSCGEA